MAFGILMAIFIPLAIIGAVAGVVFVATRGGDGFTFHNLLRGYLRLAYFISLVVLLAGATLTLTSVSSKAFGHDFSYGPYYNGNCIPAGARYGPASSPVPAPGVPRQPTCDNAGDTRPTDDLIHGISLIVAALVLGAGHRAGQMAIETTEERRTSTLAKIEALVGTAGFGIASIVFIPLGVYSLLRYLLLPAQANGGSGGDTPGVALSAAIVFLPAWLYYLSAFVRSARAGRTA